MNTVSGSGHRVADRVRVGRSVVFHEPGVPLEIRELSIPDPGPGELLLEVVLAGVCGTDPHRLAGDIPSVGHPVCFGHEAVGRIVLLGDGVVDDSGGTLLSIGDLVYWLPAVPCGECPSCRAEVAMICDHYSEIWPVSADRPNTAGFQDYALVPDKAPLYRVPESVDPAAVLAFGCAMPTAISGFRRLGSISDVVVVLGAGPVGLASTLLAALAGASQIITVGGPEPRLAVARRLGATSTIALEGTSPDERIARVRELTGGGAAVVIEAAGHRSAFSEGFEMLGPAGRFLIMGLYSGDAITPIDPIRINNLNLKIIGTLGNPPDTLRRTIEIAAEHGDRLGLSQLVTHRFPLEATEEAIRAVANGEAVKAVIAPGAGASEY